MSAILAVAGPAPLQPGAGTLAAMMQAMARRATAPPSTFRAPGITLAVARHPWETAPDLGGPARVATDGALTAVTDATLYYRADLRRALRQAGHEPAGDTAADLVLAAYRAWGADAPAHLEGDFAWALWDARARRLVCARDFGGKRPLAYAALPGGVVVASTVSGVLAHPGVPRALHPVALAETAAGLWAGSDETAYAAIRVLHAGHTLVADDGRLPRTAPHWTPPAMEDRADPPFEQAAEALRERLHAAARERRGAGGPTAVWTSGGWDSTAVLAAGESARRADGAPHPLQVVSYSYPPGDPGREDEIIRQVAARWKRPVHWLHAASVPVFDDAAARAAARDEPFAHVFETWNRALVARSTALGARVAWDGNGGDQLFWTSNVFFADLLRTLRWGELRREWRAKGGRDPRDLFAHAVQPLLPPSVVRLAGRLRGRPLRPVRERPLPPWIAPAFARAHDLEGRERAHTPRLDGRGAAADEAYWYLACPYFPRAYGLVAAFALEGGVELRSPLLDGRVVALAARRPREERNAGRETKRLLRAAMRGLLPDPVLEPRAGKTGTLAGYFGAAMRRDFPALARAAFREPRLADLGIVDPAALRAACDAYARTGEGLFAFALVQTLHTELWLRARADGPPSPDPAAASPPGRSARTTLATGGA